MTVFWTAALLLAQAEAGVPRTLLFVDDDDVLYRPGTIKRVVTMQKHSSALVIVPEKAWKGMLGWTSVHRSSDTDEDGYRLRGFSKDAALPLREDALSFKAAWKDKTLQDLPPGRYLLRIHLESGRTIRRCPSLDKTE